MPFLVQLYPEWPDAARGPDMDSPLVHENHAPVAFYASLPVML
jgi:hypothetical protein